MSTIHPTAIIDPTAEIGPGVSIGPYAVVEGGTRIGEGTTLGPHVVVRHGTTLGKGCRVFAGAVLGDEPQDLAFDPSRDTFCRIGDRTVLREHVTVHRGTKEGTETVVGDDCFLMAGSHVGHNCQVANRVILANAVLLGGYVEIGERCFLGGGSVYQQFTRVGKLTICSGNMPLNQDIPPFVMAIGYRPWIRGLNMVGLKRAGLSRVAIEALKHCFRLMYRSGLTIPEAIDRIAAEIETEEARDLVTFCRQKSKYGICPRAVMESATLM